MLTRLPVLFIILTLLQFSAQAQTGRPNIVLVICDDMRWDSFQPNGGPSFFETPSINRIAYEGANFQNAFNVYSLCIPSRSSIFTGLYPHNNGALDNFSRFDTDLPTISKALDSAGYYTGMIGKYDISIKNPGGWDYWFVSMGATDYEDPPFKLYEQSIFVTGNMTQIISDSSVNFIAQADTPFFVTVAHLAPHKPVVPLPQYEGIYDSFPMPIPSNFERFSKNYPSYIYDRAFYTDTLKLIDDLQKYFEGIRGIEDNLTAIFDALTQRGILDQTMIIFTNDNGMMFGEHLIAGKGVPYEPSMRSPLFIRYPAWFGDSTMISDELALTIDIAPTLMEAAGLDNVPYGFQGLSLRRLATGEAHRDQILFENIKVDHPSSADTSESPSFRTLRTKEYKYTRYSCETTTEELYDLVNDPMENNNLVKQTVYAPLLEQMRFKLDSMLMVFTDTLSVDTSLADCYHVGMKRGKIIKQITLKLSGNPAYSAAFAGMENRSDQPVTLSVTNMLGQVVFRKEYESSLVVMEEELHTENWLSGLYLVTLSNSNESVTERLLVF